MLAIFLIAVFEDRKPNGTGYINYAIEQHKVLLMGCGKSAPVRLDLEYEKLRLHSITMGKVRLVTLGWDEHFNDSHTHNPTFS